jgi:hypothetical protein
MGSLKELDAMVDGMNLKKMLLHHICETSKANIKEHHSPRMEQRGLHNF